MSNPAMRGNPTQLVHFKRSGNEKLAKELPAVFFNELRSLIATAGHHGLFKLHVRGSVFDFACPQGLCIKEPSNLGVTVTWNNSRNPRNGIEISLTEALPGVSGYTLYADLKKAQQKLLDDESEEDIQQTALPPALSDNVVVLQPTADHSKDASAPVASSNVPSPRVRFSENREVVTELFMEEAAKVADASGLLPKGAGIAILKQLQVLSPSPVLGAMVTHGDLVRTGNNWRNVRHRISDEWLKKLRPSQASDSQQRPVEAPVPSPCSQEQAVVAEPFFSANLAVNTKYFFAEAVKIADANGVIYARDASEILANMGFCRISASGTYKRMVKEGDLHRLPRESHNVVLFRIDQKWLAKFRSPQRDEAQKATVEQPSSRVTESDPLAFVKKMQAAITELSTLRAREKDLQGLKEAALKEVSRLDGHLADIRGKIEEYSKLEAALRTLQNL